MKTDYKELLNNPELGKKLAEEISAMIPDNIGFIMCTFEQPDENRYIQMAVLSNRGESIQTLVLASAAREALKRQESRDKVTPTH